MKPTNLLYIISDQHSYDAMGCYGSDLVQTPNLDRLAERGTRFTNAYTNCPICVPVRAALATGRYVHRDGFWDNGHPYNGSVNNGCQWLADHANDEKPWALFLSFVCPHPPYIAPSDLYEKYPLDQIPLMPMANVAAHAASLASSRCMKNRSVFLSSWPDRTCRRVKSATRPSR